MQVGGYSVPNPSLIFAMIAAAAPRRGSFPLTHSRMLITAHLSDSAALGSVVALSVHASSPLLLHVSVGYSATRTCCGLWLRAGATLCFGPAHIDENLWGSAAYRT